ncbi:MAG: hypothetical protein KatS3mg131_3131 [Candidatus Tectimicrobiota bacterium]|nr:MAG: hypothetical protein KatS3mg131_3131 [Candidatus Tectomicrobia bacterium]
MASRKALADVLTVVRLCCAGVILGLGLIGGADALPATVLVLILAWLTDALDGPLARRDPAPRHTWIGDRDLHVDVTVNFTVLVYLTLAGYVTPHTALGYTLLCAVLLGYFRSPHLAWAVQAPPYAGILYVALRDARSYGLLAVGYLILLIIITWPRFPHEVLPQFLDGMRNLGRTRWAADHSTPPGKAAVKEQ